MKIIKFCHFQGLREGGRGEILDFLGLNFHTKGELHDIVDEDLFLMVHAHSDGLLTIYEHHQLLEDPRGEIDPDPYIPSPR